MSYVCDHCKKAIDQEDNWVEADTMNKDAGWFVLPVETGRPLDEIIECFKTKAVAELHDLHWHEHCFVYLLIQELGHWMDEHHPRTIEMKE